MRLVLHTFFLSNFSIIASYFDYYRSEQERKRSSSQSESSSKGFVHQTRAARGDAKKDTTAGIVTMFLVNIRFRKRDVNCMVEQIMCWWRVHYLKPKIWIKWRLPRAMITEELHQFFGMKGRKEYMDINAALGLSDDANVDIKDNFIVVSWLL